MYLRAFDRAFEKPKSSSTSGNLHIITHDWSAPPPNTVYFRGGAPRWPHLSSRALVESPNMFFLCCQGPEGAEDGLAGTERVGESCSKQAPQVTPTLPCPAYAFVFPRPTNRFAAAVCRALLNLPKNFRPCRAITTGGASK